RPKTVNAPRRKQIFIGDLRNQFLRVIKKLASLPANLRVIENCRISSAQLPRMKEGRPIDVIDQIGNRRSDNARSGEFRSCWFVAAPIDTCTICARLLKR